MKKKHLFQFGATLIIVFAALFYPKGVVDTNAAGDTPGVSDISPTNLTVYSGKYKNAVVLVHHCDGSTEVSAGLSEYGYWTLTFPFSSKIRYYSVKFSNPVSGSGFVSFSDIVDFCGPTTPKADSSCGSFTIAETVPQSYGVPISFKGPVKITSADIYFNDLEYTLPLYLYRYDSENRIWYGYLNTIFLPLGKHNGRAFTYVDGKRGSGCFTQNFTVVGD